MVPCIFLVMNTGVMHKVLRMVLLVVLAVGHSIHTCHAYYNPLKFLNPTRLFVDPEKTDRTLDNVNEITAKLPDTIDEVVKGLNQSLVNVDKATQQIIPQVQTAIDQATRTTKAAEQLMSVTTILIVCIIVHRFVLPWLQTLAEGFVFFVRKKGGRSIGYRPLH